MNLVPNIEAQNEDKLLVERFRQGDRDAFDQLVKKYQDKTYRQCYLFTHEVGDALDLTQEIFIRVFQSLGNFKGQSSFYTWLFRIVHNICIDYTRKNKAYLDAEISIENTFDSESQSSPSNLVEAKELGVEISRAIDILPSQVKSTIILRYYEGLDYKSISDILECRIGSVKSNLYRGVRMLRNMLLPYLKDNPTNSKGGELRDYKERSY